MTLCAFFSLCKCPAELIQIQQQFPESKDADAVVGWIKSFVSQFLRKRALEQHSLKLPIEEKVAFDIITTDHSSLCYPAWSVIEETIREVIGYQ
jgi:hypothetical protein